MYNIWPLSGYKVTRVKNENFTTNDENLAGGPKVIHSDSSKYFREACEHLQWNRCTSSSQRSGTHGIAERAVRRVKEGTSAILLQSRLGEKWWADTR